MILMLRLTLGWALIGVGAVILPTPVPIGLIMLIVGLALVAPESKRLQGWLRPAGARRTPTSPPGWRRWRRSCRAWPAA